MFSKFKSLNIEITNKCKLKCLACARNQNSGYMRQTSEFKFEELKPIFDAFSNINFCGSISDPIYHPEFLDILEYVSNHNFIIISTNGHGKSLEWWTKAFELTSNKQNVKWRFGLDGLPKDSHIYRINQDGEQVFEMMKLGASMGCYIEWQYIIFNYNENDIEEAKRLAKENNIGFFEILSQKYDKTPLLKLLQKSNHLERLKDGIDR